MREHIFKFEDELKEKIVELSLKMAALDEKTDDQSICECVSTRHLIITLANRLSNSGTETANVIKFVNRNG